ncbi:MAG TPA: ectoine/hydroxyectoine ABC transporter permease subunit EhuC [Acidimicrobiia bacterium]|nr:ectoine/hydroxyectoine ABC transporter permease subunit EhuC [Acidimicrobiia bacterium]
MLEELLLTPRQYENLLNGTWVTVQVIIGSFALGTVMSLIMGVARLSDRRWLRGWALVYIEFARGISAIILLFWMFFALPILFGFGGMSPMLAGILALGLNMGAYGAEIVRGAIQSVAKGQTEAAIALNLTDGQRLRHVTLPQAVPIILPPYGNLTIEVLKGTALVSLISLTDITRVALVMRQNRVLSDDPVNVPFLFVNVLIIYLILAQVIAQLFKLAERRSAKKFGSV